MLAGTVFVAAVFVAAVFAAGAFVAAAFAAGAVAGAALVAGDFAGAVLVAVAFTAGAAFVAVAVFAAAVFGAAVFGAGWSSLTCSVAFVVRVAMLTPSCGQYALSGSTPFRHCAFWAVLRPMSSPSRFRAERESESGDKTGS